MWTDIQDKANELRRAYVTEQLVSAIGRYRDEHGYPPTLHELTQTLGCSDAHLHRWRHALRPHLAPRWSRRRRRHAAMVRFREYLKACSLDWHSLTRRQRQVVDAVNDNPTWGRSDIAAALGISYERVRQIMTTVERKSECHTPS